MATSDRASDPMRTTRDKSHGPANDETFKARIEQFAAEASRQQAARVATADRDTDEQDFIEAVSVEWDE